MTGAAVPQDGSGRETSTSGIDLLAALARHDAASGPLTSARLAALTGRDRGLVARVVDDLCDLGFIERDPASRHLRLGWALYTSAAQVVERRLVSRGQPLLEQLAQEVGESAYLVRRQGAQSVTVAEAMPQVVVRGVSWLGRSFPVVNGDAGPVLLMDLDEGGLRALVGPGPLPVPAGTRAPRTLAALRRQIDETRRTGVCVRMDETEVGVGSVGAPVRDFRGRLAGAIVVQGPSARITSSMPAIAAAVRATASRLCADLGAAT